MENLKTRFKKTCSKAEKLAEGIIGDLSTFITDPGTNLARAQEIAKTVVLNNLQDKATTFFKIGMQELGYNMDVKLVIEIMGGLGDIIAGKPKAIQTRIKQYLQNGAKQIIIDMGADLLDITKKFLGGLTAPFRVIGQAVLARQIDVDAVKGALKEAFGSNGGSMVQRWETFMKTIQHECKSNKECYSRKSESKKWIGRYTFKDTICNEKGINCPVCDNTLDMEPFVQLTMIGINDLVITPLTCGFGKFVTPITNGIVTKGVRMLFESLDAAPKGTFTCGPRRKNKEFCVDDESCESGNCGKKHRFVLGQRCECNMKPWTREYTAEGFFVKYNAGKELRNVDLIGSSGCDDALQICVDGERKDSLGNDAIKDIQAAEGLQFFEDLAGWRLPNDCIKRLSAEDS